MNVVSESGLFSVIPRWGWLLIILLFSSADPARLWAEEPAGPEAMLRLIVKANADRDLATLSKYMSHDADAIGYAMDGHKYVGWPAHEAEMRTEFEAVHKLEIPITDLQVWQKGDVAWFVMELDYIRYLSAENDSDRMVLPMRETGVLERRDGRWILVTWHESSRHSDTGGGTALPHLPNPTTLSHRTDGDQADATDRIDLGGKWEITEVEDNKKYYATLDLHGNGPYTWQGGQIATTGFRDRRWQGTWKQPGNDREGSFEVVLSEDGTEAKGIWWYGRVGTRDNIPPRQHGGTYLWRRVLQ
ncbi:MAG: nuclear transport factor 2 family protein [Nitrospiraceae bacterium]